MSDLENVSVAVSPRDKFGEYLSTRNKRLTRERELVLEQVFSSHEHFDREELVSTLTARTDGRRVSRATVYRTLQELERAGLLRKVARANGRDVFEHDYGYPQHDHLICNECGDLIEFPAAEISKVVAEVSASHGFRQRGHRLEVYGTCDACCRPPEGRHPKLDMI
ncbi:MAG: Fur family transcriptional regulator [Planctomycetota bacterium]|nr:Fur family transcriptional regulator [Planctomycetota bacterium]MEC9009223.1 Fur family transcriptional regulator [Planctomycetota bacterium]MED5449024.1 Fur family transcriptional regulator [Planctomycetota bacterium]MEE3285178.1 Fur family transcriptional regulator [Planctomycetota bacterium]MEE3366663.1 Fur family transcriptional regulator [Planctomycetota bacterium]